MLFDLRRISQEEEDTLTRDPDDICFFLYGDEPTEPPQGLLKRLFGPKPEPSQVRTWQAPPEDRILSLDKNWHVIHYLLCRSAWEGPLPQAMLAAGGEELGSEDVGYGPARILAPQQVGEFSDFLNTVKQETYASGVTGADLEEHEIYGGYPEWSAEDSEAIWEYVEELKAFFRKAAERNESILMYIY